MGLAGRPSSASRVAGLCVGFVGVVLLAWDSDGLGAGGTGAGAGLAIALCLAASALYGYSALLRPALPGGRGSVGRSHRQPSVGGAGAGVAGLLGLARSEPAAEAMAGGAGAGTVLHRHSLRAVFQADRSRRAGRAIAVTFLVPAFAMLWASVFLGEAVTPGMLALCAPILLGTGLATGVLRLPTRWRRGR